MRRYSAIAEEFQRERERDYKVLEQFVISVT